MIAYVISAKMYWKLINEEHFTHLELIVYLNRTIGLLGTIVELHISAS